MSTWAEDQSVSSPFLLDSFWDVPDFRRPRRVGTKKSCKLLFLSLGYSSPQEEEVLHDSFEVNTESAFTQAAILKLSWEGKILKGSGVFYLGSKNSYRACLNKISVHWASGPGDESFAMHRFTPWSGPQE